MPGLLAALSYATGALRRTEAPTAAQVEQDRLMGERCWTLAMQVRDELTRVIVPIERDSAPAPLTGNTRAAASIAELARLLQAQPDQHRPVFCTAEAGQVRVPVGGILDSNAAGLTLWGE